MKARDLGWQKRIRNALGDRGRPRVALHEDWSAREEVRRSSDRSFGLVFAAVFLVIGLVPLIQEAHPRPWALGVSAVCFLVALLRPALLAPLNRLWFRFGLLVGRITNPVVIGAVFFAVLTPAALVLRLAGRDPLRLRRDPKAKSYWIERVPPGPPPASMVDQF